MTSSSGTSGHGDSRPEGSGPGSGSREAGDCGKLLLLQAEFDGELDAGQAAALAEHRAGCPVCKRNEALLAATRGAMHAATYHRASPELVRAVAGRFSALPASLVLSPQPPLTSPPSPLSSAQPALPSPQPALPSRRPEWLSRWPNGRAPLRWGAIAGFVAGAALAAAVILTLFPMGRSQLVSALVDDHIRALQPGHLLDVVSTSQHTVKPWFDGRIDFAPPVKDLTPAGFPLLGGRLDYLDGRSVAVLVYSHGKHIVELFVWPASATSAEPARATKDGYNLIHWTANGISFSAVSDLEPAGLEDFARYWRQTP